MSLWSSSFINNELSKRTSIFGLRLYVVIGIITGAFIVLFLFLLSLCLSSRRQRRPPTSLSNSKLQTPPLSKEIIEIDSTPDQALAHKQTPLESVQIDAEKGESKGGERSGGPSPGPPPVSHLGWGHWYTLRELEEATGGLAEENVIGEGGYGIVYRGVLADKTVIAVKNLLNNK